MGFDPLTSWHTDHHNPEPFARRAGSFGEYRVEDIARHVTDARRSRPTIRHRRPVFLPLLTGLRPVQRAGRWVRRHGATSTWTKGRRDEPHTLH